MAKPPKRKLKRAKTLSIIIPVYNEVTTIGTVISTLKKSGLRSLELVVIDDGSTDGTRQKLQKMRRSISHLILRPTNGGKGAAVRDGFKVATGKIVAIQDADLEYDPKDLKRLIKPIQQNKADVVFGSRFIGSEPHRVVYFWHSVANQLLTLYSNFWTNLNLTDMETGYKVMRRSLITQMNITESGFGLEPELTAKLAIQKVRIYEMGISYHGRTYQEGKKIGMKDFFRALWVITKYGWYYGVNQRLLNLGK